MGPDVARGHVTCSLWKCSTCHCYKKKNLDPGCDCSCRIAPASHAECNPRLKQEHNNAARNMRHGLPPRLLPNLHLNKGKIMATTPVTMSPRLPRAEGVGASPERLCGAFRRRAKSLT